MLASGDDLVTRSSTSPARPSRQQEMGIYKRMILRERKKKENTLSTKKKERKHAFEQKKK